MRMIYTTVCLLFVFSQVQSQTYYQESEKGNVNRFTYVKPPSTFLNRDAFSKVQTSTITFTYIGNWDPQAIIATDYAAYIWSYLINSNKPIKIKAELKSLPSGALAQTEIVKWVENFPNAPHQNVKYPVSLAEAISDQELNLSNEYEIHIDVNSNETDWYYGLDGNTPAEKIDFLSVILHEITHGLGFSGSFQFSSGVGSWGIEGKPAIYDLFPVFGSISSTTHKLNNTQTYPNPSYSLGDALTSNNIYFDGWKTKLMNGNELPQLYAPFVWAGGSSISHFDEDYYPAGNSNSLMTFRIDKAEAIHSPGEVGLAVLEDLGWEINRLITVLEPKGGLVYQPGTSPSIRWTDNEYGAISIDLYKYLNGEYLYHSFITSYVSQQGTMNEYDNWVVPNDNGTFKIRMLNPSTGEGYGDSDPFIISNLPTVVTPEITPAGGIHPPPPPELQITISCATPDADIYYTQDGTIPSGPPQINGTLYENPFTIDSDRTIKAKAFKNGFNESGLTTEVYIFSTIQSVATVIPESGQYPANTEITISYPVSYECWYTYRHGLNPPDPPDPRNDPNATGVWYNPSVWSLSPPNEVHKYKFQLRKNGQWGPVVYVWYDVKPEIRIAQIDDEITGGENSFGIWHRWEDDNHWEPYPDKLFIRPTETEEWTLQAQQSYKENTTRKYRVWGKNSGENYFVNHTQVPISTNTSSVLAHFEQAYDATVKNNLEGSYPVNSGHFYFQDPWFIDDNSDPKGMRNRGTGTLTEVPIDFKTTPNITTNSDHMGIFLNQGLPNWSPPYYSVKTNLTQDLTFYNTGNPAGRNHHFIFQNWGGSDVIYEDANARGTGIVFTDVEAVAEANYKGTQLSSNPDAYKNNSQRKFVRTDDGPNGTLYITYESMGYVWLEKSTDNGINWELMNGGNPIGNAEGISPCLDYHPTLNNLILSYQQKVGSSYQLKYMVYSQPNNYQYGTIEWVGTPPPESFQYSYDAKMVVSWNRESYALFVWKGLEGLLYSVCNVTYGSADWRTSGTIGRQVELAYNTPSLYCNKVESGPNENEKLFHIAYQYSNTDIHYRLLTLDVGILGPRLLCGSPTIVSANSGYGNNYQPTITGTDWVLGENRTEYVRLAWIGYRHIYEDSPPCAVINGEARVLYKFKAPAYWSSLYVYGNDVISVNTNKGTTVMNNWEPVAIAWCEGINCNWPNKYIRSHDEYPLPIHELTTTGSDIQLNNSNDFTNMYANSFNRGSLPFYFTLSENFSVGMEKTTVNRIYQGREGVVSKDSTDFYYAIGDITLDGTNVDFIELPDSIQIENISVMNEYLLSEPFAVTSNSTLTYGVQYGIVDSAEAVAALSDGSEIDFVVQLVDNQTGEILGLFDEITYSVQNVAQYANIGYQVDLTGVGNRTLVLKLVVGTSANCSYGIANRFSDTESLNKSGYKQVSYKGNLPVTEYALAQNYPNPFNPTTKIKYQLPAAGNVTLKVYDILGSEVATLVDEFKETGRYEVSFDASALASGVYIYRLQATPNGGQASEFVNVKKMLLLK